MNDIDGGSVEQNGDKSRCKDYSRGYYPEQITKSGGRDKDQISLVSNPIPLKTTHAVIQDSSNAITKNASDYKLIENDDTDKRNEQRTGFKEPQARLS